MYAATMPAGGTPGFILTINCSGAVSSPGSAGNSRPAQAPDAKKMQIQATRQPRQTRTALYHPRTQFGVPAGPEYELNPLSRSGEHLSGGELAVKASRSSKL